jgi:hypothetical protein
MIVPETSEVLTPAMWEALCGAGDILIDCYCQDLAQLIGDGAFSDTFMAADIPDRYLRRCDYLFAKKFLACLTTVVWKLQAPEQYEIACVAEELALYALIEQARGQLDERGVDADFGEFCDDAYQDLDFLWLFDPKYDGIEESPEGAFLGIGNLRFEEWFEPFLNVPFVHPYASKHATELLIADCRDHDEDGEPP